MARDEIKSYVARQLAEQARILRLFAFDQDGKEYLKRYFYYRLQDHLKNFLEKRGEPRWIIVPGLRGVGKTTILAQIFFEHRKELGPRVLYVSMDEVVKKLGSNLYEILDAWEELLGTSFSELKEDALVLVDEAHFDDQWQFALKSLYDKSRRIFIIATGSSAVALNATTDVARRSRIERMYPLKFTEYIMLADSMENNRAIKFSPKLGNRIASALFESENADMACDSLKKTSPAVLDYWQNVDVRSIERYLKFYSIPSVLALKNDSAVYASLNSVIDRIVEKDIPTVKPFSQEVLSKITALLFLLAGSESMSLETMAGNLKNIDPKTLNGVLRVLENSELLIRVYPFSLSAPKRVRQPSKYLFLASSMRAALLHLLDSQSINIRHRGKLLEDAVGMYIYRHFKDSIGWSISYDNEKNGADFIVSGGKGHIVIETGWNKKTDEQVVNTLKAVKGKYGMVVSNSVVLGTQNNILYVPFDYFFLL